MPETHRFKQATLRLISINDGLMYFKDKVEDNSSFKKELLKYIPIGAAACLEGYFRLVYRDLIDYGEPYSNNITNLRDIKFNIESVIAIHGKTVSIGDFIAHLLPTNNLEDINRNMGLIIGEDFLERLKNTKVPYDEGKGQSIIDSGEESEFFNSLNKLFELRHIFCHEIATTDIDIVTAFTCINAALQFYLTTEYLMQELAPLPQPNNSFNRSAN